MNLKRIQTIALSLKDILYIAAIGFQFYTYSNIRQDLKNKMDEMSEKLNRFSDMQVQSMDRLTRKVSKINGDLSQSIEKKLEMLNNTTDDVKKETTTTIVNAATNDQFWAHVVQYTAYTIGGVVLIVITYYVAKEVKTSFDNSGIGQVTNLIDSSLKGLVKGTYGLGEYFFQKKDVSSNNSIIPKNISTQTNIDITNPNIDINQDVNLKPIVEPKITAVDNVDVMLNKIKAFENPTIILQPLNDGSDTAAYIIGSKEILFGNTNTDFSKMPKLSQENINIVLEIADTLK